MNSYFRTRRSKMAAFKKQALSGRWFPHVEKGAAVGGFAGEARSKRSISIEEEQCFDKSKNVLQDLMKLIKVRPPTWIVSLASECPANSSTEELLLISVWESGAERLVYARYLI